MQKNKLTILLLIAAIIVIFTLSLKDGKTNESDRCLKSSYNSYLEEFMTKDGRIIDPDRKNITTSEGQSYMLLRSVAMGNRKTFDLVYKWTKNNLQRKDNLFAWIWGENKDGEYKLLDYNSASDADIDIAFSLLVAYNKWNDDKYLKEALPIINSIWDNETKRIGEYLVLMPGAVQATDSKIEVNPSYFSPYAYRFFQKYDDKHDWSCLIDSSYYYLNQVMAKTKTGLPPNWFLIENGQIVLEDSERSDFSYDAVRVFQRAYLDYVRTGDKRNLPILEKSKFFINKWSENKDFYTNYKANGELRDKDKFVGTIAILIPVISIYDSNLAAEIYKNEVDPYFKNDKYWEAKHDYYAKNLLWFGCYFYHKDSKEYKDMHKRRIKDY
jgi:endoglucanase